MSQPTIPSRPPDSRYSVRNGSQPLSLGLVQSFWALTERDIPMAKAIEDAWREGYQYLEAGLRSDRMPQVKRLLESFPLRLIAQGWAVTAEETEEYFERALSLDAAAINFHLGHAFMSVDESASLLAEVQSKANAYNLPLLIETHRGRFTQDLTRAAELMRRSPGTVIALDLSHYIVAGEGFGGSKEEFNRHIEPLLARTALIHGRISNGQSIQVALDDKFNLALDIELFWQRAMTFWLQDAPAGAVFLFEPELGPPPYAYLNSDTKETFGRATDSTSLVSLAQRAWSAAQANCSGNAGSI